MKDRVPRGPSPVIAVSLPSQSVGDREEAREARDNEQRPQCSQALSPMFKTALRRTRRSQGPYSGGTLAEDTSPRQDKKHPHSVADFCAMHEPCGVGAFGVVTPSLCGHVDACHQLAFAE